MTRIIFMVIIDEKVVKCFDSEVNAKAFAYDASKTAWEVDIQEVEYDHSVSKEVLPVNPSKYYKEVSPPYPYIPWREPDRYLDPFVPNRVPPIIC